MASGARLAMTRSSEARRFGTGGAGLVRVVGEDLEQPAPEDLLATGVRRPQIRVGGTEDRKVPVVREQEQQRRRAG
jgi:hypothetical protein